MTRAKIEYNNCPYLITSNFKDMNDQGIYIVFMKGN